MSIAPCGTLHLGCCISTAICALQRQKAAKRGSAKAVEEEASEADTVDGAPTADQFVSAHFASIPHPSAAAASQYPAGLPRPGQGLPAAAPAQWQAAGPQDAVCHTGLCCVVSSASRSGCCCCCECVCHVAQVAPVAVSVGAQWLGMHALCHVVC